MKIFLCLLLIADKVTDAEAFEICEYGRRPGDEEIRKLFPMLGN
jgi:hypothetical protein